MFRNRAFVGSQISDWFGVNKISRPEISLNPLANILVVAGGGGSGYYDNAGGGGAGGYLEGDLILTKNYTYQISVGTGGSGWNNGANSTFGLSGNIATAIGGGKGSTGGSINGFSGGSGGGGGFNGSSTGSGGSATQGNSGGLIGFGNNGRGGPSGGGGGAGAAATSSTGGTGRSSTITGSSIIYATGGNGGGAGGGDGAANTGNGGATNSSGGSGVVIIAYPNTYANLTSIDPGLTYTLDTSGRLGYKVYKFTAGSGNITV